MDDQCLPIDAANRCWMPGNPAQASLQAMLPVDADWGTILEAWHAATLRLERTHEALQAEVRRLTAELERKNRELERKDRLADLGHMAAHIAHEIRNSLVPVALYLSLLERRIADPASREILQKVTAAIRSAETTVTDLLQFAADREPQETLFNVAELAGDVLRNLDLQAAAQHITIRSDISPSLFAWADREWMRRIILNLVLNALDAMPQGGALSITARAQQGELWLSVRDTGPGLSQDALQRAFEPFFTTKTNGTGLGLAVVERLVELHRGSIEAGNDSAGGAVFTLRFPHRAVMPGSDQQDALEITGPNREAKTAA